MKSIVFGYNENPKDYTDDQAEQIAFIAAKLGIPFRPESKALQKFFFDLADNMAFGLLPEDQRPTSRGESIYGETKGEKAAGALSLIGLALPGMAGASIAGTGARALTKRLPVKTQQAVSQSLATQLAGGLGAMNIAEDPMGTPSRAIQGALLGGGYTASRSLLGMAQSGIRPSISASRFRDPLGLRGISNVGVAI